MNTSSIVAIDIIKYGGCYIKSGVSKNSGKFYDHQCKDCIKIQRGNFRSFLEMLMQNIASTIETDAQISSLQISTK